MSQSALIVEVADTERRQRQEFVFARSPIRIGRSQLNDLPLQHSFVSHCHALLHFDGARVEFVDVGSTNGSFLDGDRLEKNRRVILLDGSAITIGALRLKARLGQRQTGDTRASYAFRALGENPSPEAHTFEPIDNRAVQRPSTQAAGSVRGPSGPGQAQAALLNERFAQSFLELRRGQRQLLRDLGIQVAGSDTLQYFDSSRELLCYLLDPIGPPERIDELSRAYADLMMHEVALVSAISAGARELLEEVTPASLAPRSVASFFGWLARIFGGDARWRALENKVDELQEETVLSSVILGRSFARAYTAALGNSSKTAGPSVGPSARPAVPAHAREGVPAAPRSLRLTGPTRDS